MRPSDLLMRPTTLPPGLYDTGSNPFMVVRHRDGKNYLLIWCDPSDALASFLAGDILLKGVVATGLKVEYQEDSGVLVQELELK